MFCTNCGAEVSPDQKFCNKCGAPVIVSAVNVGANAGPGPAAYNTGEPVQFNPNYAAAPVAPKKSKVWPIVAIVLALLLVISVGVGFAIKKAYDYFMTAYNAVEELEDLDEFADLEDPDDIDDIMGDFDKYTSDFSNLPGDFSAWDKYFDEEQEEFFEDFMSGAMDSEYHDYEYAFATYFNDYVYIAGKDVIDDSSKLFSGSTKTVGEFCDYIDKEVLDDGYEIDRDLLYDLLEVHLVDSSLAGNSVEYFEQSMMYCLTFASEFSDLDIDVNYCMYMTDEASTYYYGVEADGEEETWIVDYSQKFLYMNDGETEYDSEGDYGMFSDDTLSLWLYVIDEFYGIE